MHLVIGPKRETAMLVIAKLRAHDDVSWAVCRGNTPPAGWNAFSNTRTKATISMIIFDEMMRNKGTLWRTRTWS